MSSFRKLAFDHRNESPRVSRVSAVRACLSGVFVVIFGPLSAFVSSRRQPRTGLGNLKGNRFDRRGVHHNLATVGQLLLGLLSLLLAKPLGIRLAQKEHTSVVVVVVCLLVCRLCAMLLLLLCSNCRCCCRRRLLFVVAICVVVVVDVYVY